MEKSLRYEDVYLIPRYSELKSRSEADISVEFLGRKFKAPWLPANMEAVIDEKTAHWLSENDYFYIYHRFGDTKQFVINAHTIPLKTISISVGVKQEDINLIQWLASRAYIIDFITVDVAHGHSILVRDMIWKILKIYESYPRTKKPKIIAGNVATPDAVRDLANWGANAVKIGIAGGAACSTKHQTGFHIPMFSCTKDCVKWTYQSFCNQRRAIGKTQEDFPEYNPPEPKLIPIIADGGIRENGDISKALVAGATMVMAGSLFAACVDAPGENVYKNRKVYRGDIGPMEVLGEITHKKYHGSASAKQKGEHKHVEGFEIEIPTNGLTYSEKYQELTESLKSAVSYAGGKDLSAFKNLQYLTV